MRLAQQQHAQAGLPDAAAHRQRKLTLQQHLMERQISAVVASRKRQLAVERFRADADAHGGDLQRTVENRVVKENVTVHVPIVIVRRTPVVRLAGAEFSADTLNKDGSMLLGEGIFSLLGCQIGIEILQLLRGDEGHMAVQKRRIAELGILAAHGQLRIIDAGNDARDSLMEREGGASGVMTFSQSH